MSIESIAAIGAPALTSVLPGTAASGHGAIFQTVLDGLQEVNAQMQSTQKAVESMALGNTDNLHQVMMNMEQTRLSFELLLQVRNKVLEAYQELMRMQA